MPGRNGAQRFLLLALVLLSLVGCGDSSEPEPEVTGTIAFTRGDHVWVMRADGSGQRRLTRGYGPAWSPDGRRIAFERRSKNRFNEHNPQIYVIDADGSGRRRPTSPGVDGGLYSSPVWSPDGKTIAFDGYWDGVYWISVVHADGSGPRSITDLAGSAVGPVWSRDGRSIMFTEVGGSNAVYVMKPDGSGRRVLARIEGVASTDGVVWSPDRRRFTVLVDGDLWVLSAEGRRLVRLFDSLYPKPDRWGRIAWAPDGRTIAFSFLEGKGEDDWHSEIYAVGSDGSGLRNLTDNSGVNDDDPVWSPDGRAIAFTSDRDGNADIYVMTPDGGNQRNISRSPAGDAVADWSPRAVR